MESTNHASGRHSLYEAMIIGILPTTERDAARAVYYQASHALDTDAVHVAYEYMDGYVRYLAVPGRLAASELMATPLAAAMPGSSNYKGPGVYHVLQSTTVAAIISDGETFNYIHHDSAQVFAYVSKECPHLELFDVADSPFRELEPAIEGARQHSRKTLARLAGVNMAMASGAAMVATIALMADGYLHHRAETTASKVTTKVEAIIEDLNGQQRITDQLGELQRIAAVAARAGGWIQDYEMKAGNTTFTVMLPEWVTENYVRALGADVKGEKVPDKGMVEFRKGKK